MSNPKSSKKLPEPPPGAPFEWWTPEAAAEALAEKGPNRNYRTVEVTKYATDMLNGDWIYNGDPITFDENGRLINGQHRLGAVVESGLTVPFNTIRGLPAVAQDITDSNIRRTFADVLHIQGISYAPEAAALTRLVFEWENGTIQKRVSHGSTYRRASNPALLRTFRAHPEIGECAARANAWYAKYQGIPKSLWGFAYWLTSQIDGEDADYFFSRLADGQALVEGDPVYTLREKMNKINDNQHAVPSRIWKLAIVMRAWNAYRRGDQITRLFWTPGGSKPEAFPLPQ